MTEASTVGTKYYGYLRDSEDRELRLRGERVDENTIVLQPSVQGRDLKAVLKYDPAKDRWTAELVSGGSPGEPWRLNAKVRQTKTGEPYLYAWNADPWAVGYLPTVTVFREGYRKNGGGKK